jgi:large subunit ribosomal protein L18
MSSKSQIKHKIERKTDRHRRVRAKILGTALRPRLCVFRSSRHISAQLVDDQRGVTLAACGDLKTATRKVGVHKEKDDGLTGKRASAFEVGVAISQKAKGLNIKKAVFDRGGYRYHGRVKSLAEGARKGGLEF